MQVQIPDDADFISFRDQCLGTDGWVSRYSRRGVAVWCPEEGEESRGVQKVKVSTGMGSGHLPVERAQVSVVWIFVSKAETFLLF